MLRKIPFFLLCRITQLRLQRKWRDIRQNRQSPKLVFAAERQEETYPFRCKKHQSLLRRKLGNSNPQLQENKIVNLALCIPKLDGLVIHPNETFSFWRQIGKPTRRKGFIDGLLLSHGEVRSGVGGGLCQLANLLYWLVLHTPLQVTERHHHSFDPFPDDRRTLPFGSGASVYYNYVDLRFYNPCEQSFQIKVWMTDKHLKGSIQSDQHLPYSYHIEERHHQFIQQDEKWFRQNEIWRRKIDKQSGQCMDIKKVLSNFSEVKYIPYEKTHTV